MAQRDPLVEYQREGYDLFTAMMDGIKEELVGFVFNVDVQIAAAPEQQAVQSQPAVEIKGITVPTSGSEQLRYTSADENGEVATSSSGPSKNGPCPCGSGKKYKRCHGAQ
jgi:preprotein translocase subunit SecA